MANQKFVIQKDSQGRLDSFSIGTSKIQLTYDADGTISTASFNGRPRDIPSTLELIRVVFNMFTERIGNIANIGNIDNIKVVGNIGNISDYTSSQEKYVLTGSQIHVEAQNANNTDVTLYTVPTGSVFYLLFTDLNVINSTPANTANGSIYQATGGGGGGGIFGYQIIGSTDDAFNDTFMDGIRFSSGALSGNGQSIRVYLKNNLLNAVNVKCGVFAESTNLLLANGTTNTVAVQPSTAGWVTFTFPVAPVIAAGTSYSLVFWSNGDLIYEYDGGAANQFWQARVAFGNFPAGSYKLYPNYIEVGNFVASIYITLVGAGGNINISYIGLPPNALQATKQQSFAGKIIQGGNSIHALADSNATINAIVMGVVK